MDYILDTDGVYKPTLPIAHRNEEYDETGFPTLRAMQFKHFWYRGRHRFLHFAVKQCTDGEALAAIDLGGGVGGWVKYLSDTQPNQFSELALADSSELALREAVEIIPVGATRYQVDLMNLGWENKWDIAFLLDVIEHVPDDVNAMRQAAQALKPGGKLFITTPALDYFWSYNDDYAKHLRRYNKKQYEALAEQSGLVLRDARYFMFLLSPLYWLARRRNAAKMSEAEMRVAAKRAHEIPSTLINEALAAIFAAETPLGHMFPFPWGTSILGVFEKP